VDPLKAREPAASRNPEPRLTVIIVNYESWPDVIRLVDSLTSDAEFAPGRCRVVVVDNASRGPIPEAISVARPGLELIARPDNGGFAVGVNSGWRTARSRWLLVLNPDVEITTGFLGRVFARLDHYEVDPSGPPGIVGFGLQNPDGSPQGSVGAFPSLGRSIWEQFLPRTRRKYQPGWRIRAGAVDWVTGACMLVYTPMIAELGGMDEDFFLYHEEVAFSRVARDRGWRVEYDPSVSVIHRHPLQNRPISPKMRIITRHSKLLYFRKHLPRWQFWTLSVIVTLEAAVQKLWSQCQGRQDEVRAWQTIAEVACRFRRGVSPRGRAIRELAESATSPACDREDEPASGPGPSPACSTKAPASLPGSARRHRGRPRSGPALLEHRKDGTA
jgi:N-acetylglucosaminyl-diphospho-decaprenol L-rhamnosyltransferase